jgi:UDP-glucuronate 4-epimerase
VYGPRGRPDMAVFKFIQAAYKGEPIKIFGNGEQLREFTFISDIVDGVVQSIFFLSNRSSSGYVPVFEIVNLGGGSTHTVNELVRLIEKSFAKRPSASDANAFSGKILKEYGENQPGDVVITQADVSKASEILGFSPKVTLSEGIEKTVDWWFDSYI